MSASELSERIGSLVAEEKFADAAAELAAAWRAASKFGTRHCDLPDYSGVYVRFKTHGYPFRLRRQWGEENDADGLLKLILPYVVEWNVPDISGAVVALPDGQRPASLMDEVDTPLVMWLVREFSRFLLLELVAPRPN